MANWVTATEAAPAHPQSLGVRAGRNYLPPGTRQPVGVRHAMDLQTNRAACRTITDLFLLQEIPFAPDGINSCRDCRAVVKADLA